MTSISNGIQRTITVLGFAIVIFASAASGQAIERAAFGANPAAIQAAVDQFRADLGTLNPNTRQSFRSGRREINWDGVPNGASAPNQLAPDFFNFNSPRGVMFSSNESPLILNPILQPMLVSSTAASGVPVRFGNINATYTNEFQTFSPERLFSTTPGSNVLEINFFIPGTAIPATVNGFGAVFTDVDGQSTHMQFYDATGRILLVPNGQIVGIDKGLSFQGVSYNDGTRISRVVITLGNAPLSATNTDGVNGVDVVALDDFIYGEPRAADYHEGDFDGDGATDLAVFRPSTGQWFVINSGSNTVDVANWGTDGDVPVPGDFDGDRRADLVVFRPSTGTWFRLNSSDGQAIITQWGAEGDKPETGDFDKDGRSDIAIFRPSEGNHYIIKSSNSDFIVSQWGANGDIPITTAP
jgi:hypothetical protein